MDSLLPKDEVSTETGQLHDIFLWATWGAFFIKLFVSFLARGMRLSPEQALTLIAVIVVAWIAGLIVAGVHSKKATKLRVAASINWPK